MFGDIHSKLSVESRDLTLRERGAGKSLQSSSRIEESSMLLIVRKDSDEPL